MNLGQNKKQDMLEDNAEENAFSFEAGSPSLQTEIIFSDTSEKYRLFFEGIEQGYYETDLSGKMTFFNKFFCSMVGYSENELLGKNLLKIIDREDFKRVGDVFRSILNTEKPQIGLVFQINRKDGAKRKLGTSVCLFKDVKGNVSGFMGIARDISERKNIEEQIKQAQKLESIGQLAAGIAHEINTPIQYIGLNVQFIKDSFEDITHILNKYHTLLNYIKNNKDIAPLLADIESIVEEKELGYLMEEIPKAISQSTDGLSHVSEIVVAMKLFCHPGIEDKKEVDLNELIQNGIILSRNKWKYVAEIETDFDSCLPLVPCRQGEIKQVILNLIINAAQAIEEVVEEGKKDRGKIKISTSCDGTWVEIRVSDTGKGIPMDARSKIFDPFFTTKDVGRGTGQGLAISYSVVVNNHGGTIGFETEIDKGTTMIIRIPLRSKDEIRNE